MRGCFASEIKGCIFFPEGHGCNVVDDDKDGRYHQVNQLNKIGINSFS